VPFVEENPDIDIAVRAMVTADSATEQVHSRDVWGRLEPVSKDIREPEEIGVHGPSRCIATGIATQTPAEGRGRVRQSKTTTDEKPNEIGLVVEGRGRVRHRFQNFKTGALNYSATLPSSRDQALGGEKIKNGAATGPSLHPTALKTPESQPPATN